MTEIIVITGIAVLLGFLLHIMSAVWPFLLTFFIIKWWRKWRYEAIKPGDWLRVWKPRSGFTRVVYLGKSNDGTARYWFDGWNIVVQGTRKGDWMWEFAQEVNDWEQVFHLRGFQVMGRDWPSFWENAVIGSFNIPNKTVM